MCVLSLSQCAWCFCVEGLLTFLSWICIVDWNCWLFLNVFCWNLGDLFYIISYHQQRSDSFLTVSLTSFLLPYWSSWCFHHSNEKEWKWWVSMFHSWFKGEWLEFPLRIILTVGLLCMACIMLKYILSSPTHSRTFTMKACWRFSKPCSIEMTLLFFLF